MAFDVGKFFNFRLSRNSKVPQDGNNTREAEKNMKFSGNLFQYDTPDEDVRIEERHFTIQKYAVAYFPEDDDIVVAKYAVPDLPGESEHQALYGIQVPDPEIVEKYAVPDLPGESEHQALYGIQVPYPEDVVKYAVPDLPDDPEVHPDYGIQIPYPEDVVKYAVPDLPDEPEAQPAYGIQVPSIGPIDISIQKYAVPEIPGVGGTYKPTTGNIWTRLPKPIKIEFPTIFAERFPSLSARMEQLFKNITSWYKKD